MKSMSGFGGGVASLIMKTVGGGDGIVTDQLFLNLDAANYTSGSTWNDSSGNALNATLNGPTYNSNFGGYFDFDGTNDYATLPTLAIAGNEFTFSVWNYGIVAQFSGIIFLGDTGDNSGGRILSVHLPYSGNIVYFDKGTTPGSGQSGPGNQYDRTNKTASDAEYKGWHHWVFTANASTGSMKIYLDGALWHSDTGKTKTFSNVNGNVRRIGSMYSGSYHRGYISNLQLYKKELSQAEVTQNFNAMASRFGLGEIVTDNLVLHLDAGNSSSYSGSGTTWTDLSGEGNNVTLVNGPTHSFNDGVYFDFDGTNDYINANTALPDSFFQGNSTISFWIYFNTVDSDSQGQAVLHHGSNSLYNGFHIMQRNSEVGLALWGTSLYSSTTLSASTWYNLTITHNNTTNAAKVYLNGSLDASGTLASSYVGSGNNCRIAGPIIEGGVYHDELHARIAQVLCYERVLTASEVQQNFDATKGRYGL